MDLAEPCDIDLSVMKFRSAWPIFHGPVFLPNILKTIWCINIILWDYESVWPDIWPQNKCRSLWPIFHGPVIFSYILKTVWCLNIILQDYESLWPNVWPQNKYRSLWPIFHGPVILSYVLKTILCMNILLGIISQYDTTFDIKINKGHWTMKYVTVIISQYDPTFDLKVNVCHCDLYFMVQWFCLISWKLVSGWTSYLGLWVSITPHLTSKYL